MNIISISSPASSDTATIGAPYLVGQVYPYKTESNESLMVRKAPITTTHGDISACSSYKPVMRPLSLAPGSFPEIDCWKEQNQYQHH